MAEQDVPGKRLVKVEFASGIVKDDTPLASEGGWIDSSLVRFWQGKPEVIGGWEKVTADTVGSSVRSMHAWSDLNGRRHLALGADGAVNVLSDYAAGLTLVDIASNAVVTETATAILATADSPSITVTATSHGLAAGTSFSFDTSPGLVGGIDLGGSWTVATVPGANSFTVNAPSNAQTAAILTGSGSTWTSRSVTPSTHTWGRVRYSSGSGRVFATTTTAEALFQSTSGGDTWTQVTGPTGVVVRDVWPTATGWIAVGDTTGTGRIFTNNNTNPALGSWTSRLNTGGIVRGLGQVTLGGGGTRYIAVGDGGTIRTSDDDGATWSSRTSGTSNNLYGVAGATGENDVVFAVGNGVSSATSSTANIHRSTDGGVTWAGVASGVSQNMRDVATGSNNFNRWYVMAVGLNGARAFINEASPSVGTSSFSGGTSGSTDYYAVAAHKNNTTSMTFYAVGADGSIASGTVSLSTSSSSGITGGNRTFYGVASGSDVIVVGANGMSLSGSYPLTSSLLGGATLTSRQFSLDNFGELLLVAPQGGGLYAWQPGPYTEQVTNGTFATDTSWAKGTGWTIGSGVATKTSGVAANLSQAADETIKPGYRYKLNFDMTRSSGTLTFKVNAGDPTPTLIDVGSPAYNTAGAKELYFTCPDAPSDIVFEADGNFAGTVDNVTITPDSELFQIDTAPSRIGCMWVDPVARIVNIGDTIEADGDYNPLAVRNSAQENFRVWVPDVSNIADEVILARGSRVVQAKITRQQTLIFTDAALFSQQFSGQAAATYIYRLMGVGCGLIGRNAVAEVDGAAFWLSGNGQFYLFNGQQPQIINCRLRRDVIGNIATGYEDRIAAGVNGAFTEVWFMYPDQRDVGSPDCTRVAAFNYLENHWVTHQLSRTSFLQAGAWPFPIASDTSGALYYHEKGRTADGSDMASFLESAAFDIEDGGNIMALTRLVPDFEGQTQSVDFTVNMRHWPNAELMTIGPLTATTSTHYLNFRRTARQAKIRMDSTGSPLFWRLGALRFDVMRTGALR
jgi:hypothetical protein